MIRIISKILITFLFGVGLLAAPSSGDYSESKIGIWYQDPLSSALENINTVVCLFTKLNLHKNVDSGPYKSKVNLSQCSDQSGETEALWVEVVSDVKNNPNIKNAYISNIWLDIGSSHIFYIKFNFDRPQNNEAINGEFTINGCQAASESAGDCIDKYYAVAKGNRVDVYETSVENSAAGNNESIDFNLISITGSNSGYGAVKVYKNYDGGTKEANIDYTYAYKNNEVIMNTVVNNFGDPIQGLGLVRASGTACYDRRVTKGTINTYFYQVFNDDGSIYKIDKPHVPFRLIDEAGHLITDTNGNPIVGRVMWNTFADTPALFFPSSESYVAQKISNGEKILAESWIGGIPNFRMGVRVNPADATKIQITDLSGNLYEQSTSLKLNFQLTSDRVIGLVDQNLKDTNSIVWFSGNGFIQNLPQGAQILDGASLSGVKDGKTYYVRPLFYSVTPGVIPCPNDANTQLQDAVTLRYQINNASSFTRDPGSNQWVDPRAELGAKPNLTSSNYKYIDGIKQ